MAQPIMVVKPGIGFFNHVGVLNLGNNYMVRNSHGFTVVEFLSI